MMRSILLVLYCLLLLPQFFFGQGEDQPFKNSLDSLRIVYNIKDQASSSIFIQLTDSLLENSFQLTNKGKFNEARILIQFAEKICNLFIGKDQSIYPKLYYSSTYIFSKENDMRRTDSAGTAALTLLNQNNFSENEHLASIYYLLAYANDLLENRTKALDCIQKALEIVEKKTGNNSDLYFRYYNGLCNIYKNSGKTEKALTSYKNLMNLIETSIGKKNKNYINCLSNLSNLYLGLDSLSKVEALRVEALELSEQAFGRKSEESMIALFNLGTYYKNVRQMSRAKSMLLEAKSISDSSKLNRIYRARILNNLISFYSNEGKKVEALNLTLEVVDLISQSFGRMNSQYALALANLGPAYLNLGMNLESEHAYSNAIELYYQLNDQGYDFQKCRSGIAILKFNQDKYGEVIEILESVITNKIENHKTRELSFLLADLYLISHAYLYLNQDYKADSFFRLAEKLMVDKYRQILKFMSFSEFENYIGEHQYFISQLLSCYFYKSEQLTEMAELAYNDIMMYKSILLNQYLKQKSSINNSLGLKDKYDRYRSINKMLISQISKSKSNQLQIDSLKSELEKLEKYLSQNINQFGNSLDYYSWKEISEKLNPSELAIEFVAYENYLDSTGNLSLNQSQGVNYCALIIRKGFTNPRIIHLCNETELLEFLNQPQINFKPGTGFQLYDLVWKKMEPHLNGVSKIYFSPAGLLNRINLSAIQVSEDEQLLDRFELIQLIGTRQLIELKELSKPINALLVGGIDYDSQISESVDQSMNLATVDVDRPKFMATDSILRGGEWRYLFGSEVEIDSVSKILGRQHIVVNILNGKEGSESLVISHTANGKSPGILHFATHGYFFPDSYKKSEYTDGIENVFIYSESPMLRSGLILAGGNRTWKGINDVKSEEDGILTAYEVSQLDLGNTGLVILSACETGLGDIKGNEGVYGLQRAFKIAGVDYIIMSLWKVPDQATKEFMVKFYSIWQDEGKTIPVAFRQTQIWMRERYIGSLYWAGFVLIQ